MSKQSSSISTSTNSNSQQASSLYLACSDGQTTIEHSWNAIVCASLEVMASIKEGDGLELIDEVLKRHQLLDEHFARFPIGPDNAGFYHQHLSTFLEMENAITRLTQDSELSLQSWA